MTSELHLDFETRSEVDLKKVGAHAYFEHPSTQILCAAWAFNNGKPQIWFPGDYVTDLFSTAEQPGTVITAWNAAFERLAWRHIMVKQHKAPPIRDHQWRCTMTEALSMNLPGALKDAAPAVGLDIVKDDIGHRLMMKMTKPRKARKKETIGCLFCGGSGAREYREILTPCVPCNGTGFITEALAEATYGKVFWHENPEDLKRLGEYCLQDVRVETEIGKSILRLRPSEQELYLLDMQINDRGVFIDKKLCQAAEHIVETATDRLDDEMSRVTKGNVSACSNIPQLTKWLKFRGVDTESVDREHIEDRLILDLPDDCRRALELRQEGSKTSTAKIGAMLRRQQADGRIRGNLQFYGASATGRWAARGVQLQNLTRPQILGSKAFKATPLEEQIESAIDAIHSGSSMVIELIYGQPLTLVADCVRSMVCAPDGKILRSSDFANIEGRAVAWLAGQEDKLDAFRAYDAGTGPDIYLVSAAGIFNVSISEAGQHRQIGKVAELALGYQGGPRAFAKMAKGYGMRIAQHYDGIWKNSAEEFKDQALSAWDDRGRKTGMTQEGWLASEVIKLAWRAKNFKIADYWALVEQAAIDAVKYGTITVAGHVKFRKAGSFLFCQLPSGRAICYPYPRLKETKTPWGDTRIQLVYKSVDQFTKKWQDKTFYGGLGVENITQAVARDFLAEAMLRVDKAGYNLVLTVHDEPITEDDESFGKLEEFNTLMRVVPPWAPNFPIAVGGWEGKRYRKG